MLGEERLLGLAVNVHLHMFSMVEFIEHIALAVRHVIRASRKAGVAVAGASVPHRAGHVAPQEGVEVGRRLDLLGAHPARPNGVRPRLYGPLQVVARSLGRDDFQRTHELGVAHRHAFALEEIQG